MDIEAESSVVGWYRSLSSGQVSCLQLLYLFPRNYEFHKDEVIQLWIAQGLDPLPPSADMEFCARSYFKEFEEHGVFQLSTFGCAVGKQRYKLSNSFVDLLAQNHDDGFHRIVDSNSHISENTKHASLRDDSIYETTLKELYKAERLATLLILHQRGTHLDHLPHDLFLNLPLLRVLDLSHTSLTELPSSIGDLKDLRYLNLSYTPITALPYSLCSLYQMQTLKLKGCLKLVDLPRGMRKLINLRHLEVDLDCLLVSMPLGLGDLAELRTLPAFVVGKESGCQITELSNMMNLCGSLSILRLQNVSSSVEAKESALDNKRYLQTVELHWTDCVDGLEVLENLQPHTELEELQIVGYGGAKFPSWIGDPIFSKLATITICDCRNSESLPPLGKLPSLQRLSISDMHAVKKINSSFCGKNMVSSLSCFKTRILKHRRPDDHDMFKAFQSLEKLTLNRMPMLKTWSGIEEGDFPNLQKLNISHCPKLTSLPKLSLLISLKQLEISLCPLLKSFPNKGLPTSLQCLVIIDCPRLKVLFGRRDWGELGHIPCIWIDYQQIQANPSSTAVNSSLPSQNLESTVQVPLDTNAEKGKRAGLDSLTMVESHGSSEKRQANPSSTAVNSPLPSQNLESTDQVQLDTNVEKGKRAGIDSLTMIEAHGSYEKREANPSSTAVNSPLPSQNLESTDQVPLDTNVEKGKRAGLDSLTMIESPGSSEKRQANPSATAVKSPLPSQNLESTDQVPLETNVETGKRAGLDSLTMIESHGSSEKRQANPSSTAVNSPLPFQNLESTVLVPWDTNVEKGIRAGLDSLTMIQSHGSSEKRQANPSSTAVNSPLPSQNLESTDQVPLATNAEKGKRAGLDSLTMIQSHGSSEKRQANPSSTAVNSPFPFQNSESTDQVPLDTNVEKGKRAGLDSLTMIQSHGSSEKRQTKQKAVIKLSKNNVRSRTKARRIAVTLPGVHSAELEGAHVVVIIREGIDADDVVMRIRKIFGWADLVCVGLHSEKEYDTKQTPKLKVPIWSRP